MRAMDEEWRCPCDRAVSFRNGLIEDMIRNGWYHAESDLEQVEAEAVAAERTDRARAVDEANALGYREGYRAAQDRARATIARLRKARADRSLAAIAKAYREDTDD
jgi:flagellar biosynthesis/type III secretory pathway protein FliH